MGQDERLNSGKRAVRLDSCLLPLCPKRRRAYQRLVNIDDFEAVNQGAGDTDTNSDLVESSKTSVSTSSKDCSEADALFEGSKHGTHRRPVSQYGST